jgi:hypothetical protein
VFDLYDEALAQYKADLAEWRARQDARASADSPRA